MVRKTTYENGFKAKVALNAIRGDKTIAEIATEYNVNGHTQYINI
jgi:transposase-like protein